MTVLIFTWKDMILVSGRPHSIYKTNIVIYDDMIYYLNVLYAFYWVSRLSNFFYFSSVREFYCTIAETMIKKFPFQDKVLQVSGSWIPTPRTRFLQKMVSTFYCISKLLVSWICTLEKKEENKNAPELKQIIQNLRTFIIVTGWKKGIFIHVYQSTCL